ncbi:hypothetical protein BDY24DRAFT_373741 [Mrakia frigida]|uniref:uncharacterized protein n=1 Tax=Mrakia frigida TaxID=29902 RepID=UPI003FCC1690
MSMNVTLPFTSPFLRWSPFSDGNATQGWNATGNGFGNRSPLGEVQDAFRWTRGVGSKVELSFNGSAAYIYGSVASSSTTYTVSLDSTTSSPEPAGSLLASFDSLDSGTPHTLSLEVTGAGTAEDDWAGIGQVILTVPVGSGQSNLTYDDADTNYFVYGGTWGVGAAASQGTYLQTTTYTQQKSATATVTFTGSAVYLYGSIQPDHGLYTISVDGEDSGATYNGSSKAGFVQQLLFFGSGYESEEEHTLVITDSDGTKLDVDYVVVLGATSSERVKRIAGISVGAASAAIIVGSIVFWIWRTERNGRRKLNDYVRTFVEKSETY